MSGLDLAALWEAHCHYEFETRDVDSTMTTMVSAPYVNHIPTMTGGCRARSTQAFLQISFHRCESSRFSAYAY